MNPSEQEPAASAPLDAEQLAQLFTAHRDHLRRMVEFRLAEQLRQRVDPSDVLQEAYLKAQQQLPHVAKGLDVPVVVWLRQVTEHTLIDVERRHLAEARSVLREVPLRQNLAGQTTSISLAAVLAGDTSTPSQQVLREERRVQLEIALEQMDPVDREVLALRHFEELGNNEVAEVLGMQPSAASNRYIRALQRLKEILDALPQFAPSSTDPAPPAS